MGVACRRRFILSPNVVDIVDMEEINRERMEKSVEHVEEVVGIIINPCYRRPAVLRALIDGSKDSGEKEDDKKNVVIYLDHDPNFSSMPRGGMAAEGGS